MKALLVGNPNAGKSTLFNALTGGHARVGNWHGVTVGALEGTFRCGGDRLALVDLPGIYSENAMSMEERFTRDRLRAEPSAAVFFVCECAQLPRNLTLFARLTEGRRAALVLTKRRRFEAEGGALDAAALSRLLRVPVICAEGLKREQLAAALLRAVQRPSERRAQCEKLPPAVYRPVREGLSRADLLLTNGWICIPLFLCLLAAAFFLTFAPGAPGEWMKRGIGEMFTALGGAARRIPSPVLSGLLADGVCAGMGAVLGFLPQIALLYLALILMEESGFLSRLAMLTDGIFAKVGLNGRAVFSLAMGFGCTAAAIATTRGLDDRIVQRRTIFCLPYISCSAKLPVYLTLSASFFPDPFSGALLLYALGVLLALAAAFLQSRGPRPPFVMELAPLQIPRPLFVCRSLLFQIKQFIIKTATVILAFFLASWLLSSFDLSFRLCAPAQSMLARLCGGLGWLFAPVGMNDWRIAYAALSGLIAKENVAGAIAMFYGAFPYGAASAFAFAVFILACSPCVSAIAAAARETGWKRALCYAAVQTAAALLGCYAAYFLWTGGAAYALPAGAAAAAYFVMRKTVHEKIRRKRRHHAEKVHR